MQAFAKHVFLSKLSSSVFEFYTIIHWLITIQGKKFLFSMLLDLFDFEAFFCRLGV